MTSSTTLPADPPAYEAVRRSAAVAHPARSLVVLRGADSFDFLHRMTTNDLLSLPEGEARRTVIVTGKGRVVDLVSVARRNGDAVILGSPGLASTLSAWFDRYIITDDVRVVASREFPAVAALAGPDAPLLAGRLPGAPFMVREELGRVPQLLFPPDDPIPGEPPAIAALLSSDPSVPPMPPGLPQLDAGTLECLRIEEGVPASGKELGEDTNALEAGLKPFISFSKGCYIGQEVIARLDTYRKLRRIIAGFAIHAPAGTAPVPGPLRRNGADAGRITSVVFSRRAGGWIGLGFRRIAAGDVEFELDTPGGGPPLRCTCTTGLPPGYEEYALEA